MGASCEVRDLVKVFAGKRVVDNVSLSIEAGEFLVMLGPSGCGKTTTLRMIAGLETPTSGTVSIGGSIVSDPAHGVSLRPEKRDLGMVFQSYAIWPHMTVAENIAFPLRARGLARGAALRRKVQDALELVGLDGLGDRPSSQLSGGQMQRVVLARAVVYDPQILLFDEPLSNLDLKMRERLRGELKALQKRTGLTSIYVTHDQTEAVELADRIAVMDGGRVAQIGTPMDIYRRPATRFVAEFISSANIFAGRVVAHDGAGRVRVSAAQGRLFTAECDGPMAVGAEVDVVIHPEEVTLAPGPAQSSEDVTVRIIERQFQGVSMRYVVEWGGAPFNVVAFGRGAALDPGSEARLSVPPGSARVLQRALPP